MPLPRSNFPVSAAVGHDVAVAAGGQAPGPASYQLCERPQQASPTSSAVLRCWLCLCCAMQGLTEEECLEHCGLLELADLLKAASIQMELQAPQRQGAAVCRRAAPPAPGLPAGHLADYCASAAQQLAEAATAAAAAETTAAAAAGVGRQQAAADGAQRAHATGTDPELAIRRALALALRSCANPRCSNLSGASEGAVRGRKCGGCGSVRYCGDACCRADWQAHRVACKLLRRQQGSTA